MKKFYKVFGSVLICLSAFLGTIKDSTVFAAGTQATLHTFYKTNTLGNAYEYVVISVEFADYTSGTIVIEVGNLSFYDYIVFGARLSNIYSSGNTRRLTLQVDDCKQAIIYCLPHAGSMVSVSPSIYSNSTSYVEHVNQSFIESQFTTTNGYIDDLESTCSNIYTDVHNMYLLLVDEANDLDNIQSQLTTLGNYLSTTNTSLELIRQTIALTNQSLSSIISGINAINDANYNIPYESLMAYAFFREMGGNSLKTLDGYYAPYYAISSLTKTNVLLRTGYTYYLSYIVNRTNSGFIDTIKTSSGTSATFSVVGGLPLANNVRVITYQITVTSQDYYTFTFNSALNSCYVVPLYYGNGENISDQMKSITGIDTLSEESQRLEDIYTWLTNFSTTDYTSLINTLQSTLTNFSNNTDADLDGILSWLNSYDPTDYSDNFDSVILLLTSLVFGDDTDQVSIYDLVNTILSAVSGVQSIVGNIDSFNQNTYLPIVQSINSLLSNIDSTLSDLSQYTLPLESYTAYSLFRNLGTSKIQTLDGYTAPYVLIDTLSVPNVLLRTGYTYYLSYIVNRTNSGFLRSIDDRATYSTISGLTAVNNSRVITYQITVSETDWYTLTFWDDLETCLVIPLYFGNGLNISDEMKSITGINPSEQSVDDSSYDGNVDQFNQNIDDYNDITDDIFNQFNDSTSQLDLTDDNFSIGSDVLSAFNFISTNVQSLVTNNSSISILFYLPVLLGIAFIFLGMRRDK